MGLSHASALGGFQLLHRDLMLSFGSGINRIIEREGQTDLTFWVYHGDVPHILQDMPLWMYRGVQHIFPSALQFVGEYPAKESGVRVLVVSTFGHPEQLSQRAMTERMNRVLDFNTRVGGVEVALGGILPNTLGALGIRAPEPISFANEAGPVYGIVGAVEAEFFSRGLVKGKDAIGIIGLGRIGGRTMRRLREPGHRLIVIEKSREGTSERGRVLYTNEVKYLQERNVQILVVITRRGDDIEDDLNSIPGNCSIFDETFPSISSQNVTILQQKGCVVSRIFLTGINATRAFGGYAIGEVPACLVQPMVRIAATKFPEAMQRQDEPSQDWVDRVAKDILGLTPNTVART